MNSVTVDGKNYVKAKHLARELGYTTDYVGQLCRAEKVDAQLVGRSWYVNEASLRAHKQTRYRSNKQETIKQVERSLQAKDADEPEESFSVPVHAGVRTTSASEYASESFYDRLKESSVPKYHPDDTDLMPTSTTTHKTGTVGVRLADAQSVKIKSKSKSYNFDPSEQEKLRFEGKIKVSAVEEPEEQEEAAENEEKTNMVAVEVKKSEKTPEKKDISSQTQNVEEAAKIKVVHRRPSTKKKKRALPYEHNTKGVLGMRRRKIIGRNPAGGTLMVNAEADTLVYEGGIKKSFVLVAVFLAVVGGVLLSSFEQKITIQQDSTTASYVLNFANAKAAAYDAFR